jgi:hypothetical protein
MILDGRLNLILGIFRIFQTPGLRIVLSTNWRFVVIFRSMMDRSVVSSSGMMNRGSMVHRSVMHRSSMVHRSEMRRSSMVHRNGVMYWSWRVCVSLMNRFNISRLMIHRCHMICRFRSIMSRSWCVPIRSWISGKYTSKYCRHS